MPDAGQFQVGDTVKLGYVDQTHKDIHPDKSVLMLFLMAWNMLR